ncbi:hypothetical protein JOB18_028396 [Solea senegalensis]|uniref:Uncharacterized protein n=1 Tax=Solea senegalensis TaxID=28829 RepID=A0AAV6PS86_SOLSE|nr:hypothetical protein JOB18_028396 [Solea senegalensis]
MCCWRTMKLFLCCLLLLVTNVVFAAPIRAQRENVLSFLNDALGTMNVPGNVTAYTKPPSEPVTENNSEDISDANSSDDKTGFEEPEQTNNNGGDSTVKDLESHEIMAMNDNAPSRRKTGVDKVSVGTMDMSRELIQDYGSREWTGLDSEEGMTVDNQKGGKHTSGSDLQRKAERVNVLDRELSPDESRDLPDGDSVEENRGRLAAAVNSKYDEQMPSCCSRKETDFLMIT